MCVTINVLVQQTLGWFGAYPEKQIAFRDLAETIDTAAVPTIATKQPITPSRLNHVTYDVSLQNLPL